MTAVGFVVVVGGDAMPIPIPIDVEQRDVPSCPTRASRSIGLVTIETIDTLPLRRDRTNHSLNFDCYYLSSLTISINAP